MHTFWEYSVFVSQRETLCNPTVDYCVLIIQIQRVEVRVGDAFNLAPNAPMQCSDLFILHQQLQQQAKEY